MCQMQASKLPQGLLVPMLPPLLLWLLCWVLLLRRLVLSVEFSVGALQCRPSGSWPLQRRPSCPNPAALH